MVTNKNDIYTFLMKKEAKVREEIMKGEGEPDGAELADLAYVMGIAKGALEAMRFVFPEYEISESVVNHFVSKRDPKDIELDLYSFDKVPPIPVE